MQQAFRMRNSNKIELELSAVVYAFHRFKSLPCSATDTTEIKILKCQHLASKDKGCPYPKWCASHQLEATSSTKTNLGAQFGSAIMWRDVFRFFQTLCSQAKKQNCRGICHAVCWCSQSCKEDNCSIVIPRSSVAAMWIGGPELSHE